MRGSMRHFTRRPSALLALCLGASISACGGESLEPGVPSRGHTIAVAKCTFCHQIDGQGGMIAPPMDHCLGLVSTLVRDYEKRAADLELTYPKAYAAEAKAIEALIAEQDPQRRYEAWLANYLRDTKFDNPMTKMGNVLLTEQQRADVIAWLMSKRPQQ